MSTADLLRKVRRLEIRSRRLVEDLFAGGSASMFKGRGVEFEDGFEELVEERLRLGSAPVGGIPVVERDHRLVGGPEALAFVRKLAEITPPHQLFDAALEVALPQASLAAQLPEPPKGRTVVIGAGKAAASSPPGSSRRRRRKGSRLKQRVYQVSLNERVAQPTTSRPQSVMIGEGRRCLRWCRSPARSMSCSPSCPMWLDSSPRTRCG